MKSNVLTHPNVTLIDVREPYELASGQVEGAINIPLGEVPQRLDDFKAFSGPIVLFCRSGNRSGMAVSILKANGITEAYNGGSWEEVAEVLIQ